MERSRSVPVSGSDRALTNPFFSEKVNAEITLQQNRPMDLPPPTPGAKSGEDELQPVRDEVRSMGGLGKGRGGALTHARPECFVTPPSRRSAASHGNLGDAKGVGVGAQSEGATPVEVCIKTEGRLPHGRNVATDGHAPSESDRQASGFVPQQHSMDGGDGLQRALEKELVDHLRAHNSKLLAELESMKVQLQQASVQQCSATPNPPKSDTSWQEVGGDVGSAAAGSAAAGSQSRGRSGWQTPRRLEMDESAKKERFTPNGTQVPAGTPPVEAMDGVPPPPPPLPPFPVLSQHDAGNLVDMELYDKYEKMKESGRMGDVQWKPSCERTVTPSEARAIWLEKEVSSLRSLLDHMTENTSFAKSSYWSQPFQRELATEAGGPPQVRACGSGRAACAPELPQQGRACSSGVAACASDLPQQGRACAGVAACASELPQQGRACAGVAACASDLPQQGRACAGVAACASDLPQQGRACEGAAACASDLPQQDRAFASMASGNIGAGLLPGGYGPALSAASPLRGAGMPVQWHDGSGGGLKTELPELPSDASPIQLGDWLAICGPTMRDISAVSSRWWQLTLREAHCYYAQWREATPLDRIQIAPRLPDELNEGQYQRTEQRGVHLLLKAIPQDQVQVLVTSRELTSTNILFRLLVRFQPGGPGEKQLLLTQLTQLEKSTTMAGLGTALRSWRRHHSRAMEIGATLPDGSLLLRALEPAVQQIAAADTQAAFRLAQSRAALAVDERPSQQAVWSYSQCLLTEAETLILTSTSATSLNATPIKVKQLEAGLNTPSPATPSKPADKGKGDASAADKPCRFFVSDAGCRAGNKCKWRHSWDDLKDGSKGDRCWICGSKEHRKTNCPVLKPSLKASKDGKDAKEVKGKGEAGAASGGGSGGGRGSASVGAKLQELNVPKSPNPLDACSTTACSTTSASSQGTGEQASNVGSTNEETAKGSAALLQEATKLLKSLQVTHPKLKTMRMSSLEVQHDEDWVLLDSGATHALRPAASQLEWDEALDAQVMLADGITTKLKMKPESKILISDPAESSMANSWIAPLGGIAELGYRFEWKDGCCSLRDPGGRSVDARIRHGCPVVAKKIGFDLMAQLEQQQSILIQRMALVKALMEQPHLVDDKWSAEVALTLKLRHLFPNLPEDILAGVAPDLTVLHRPELGEALPWNRRKRRRLQQAQNVVVHLFAGPDHRFWEKKLNNAKTEVLCVDLLGNIKADLHDDKIFAFLLTLAASGRVKAILAGPPCRTISALRFQEDGGPAVVRNEDFPYGLPDLSPEDAQLVLKDSALWFRMLLLYMVCEDCREVGTPPTALVVEQPEDPARYRDPADVAARGYMAIWRTLEWRQFAEAFKVKMVHLDQGPLGHSRKKPTSLAVVLPELEELDEIRGPPKVASDTGDRSAMSLQERCAESKTWACWAPGLKLAIAVALQRWLVQLGESSLQSAKPVLRPLSAVALESWRQHFLNDHMPSRRDCKHCVQSQARGKPHCRVEHPESYTLSIDLSGRMAAGYNQSKRRCKYMMVGCYTFPVTRSGQPLAPIPNEAAEAEDHPLPPPDFESQQDVGGDQPCPVPADTCDRGSQNGAGDVDDHMGHISESDGYSPSILEAEPFVDGLNSPERAEPSLQPDVSAQPNVQAPPDVQVDPDILGEEPFEDDGHDIPAAVAESAETSNKVWHRLIEENKSVGVQTLTFVEVLETRHVDHVLPALARIHARLRALGLPVLRLHSDRARELLAKPVRRWTLDREMITTLTSGNSFKANGRCEAEVGYVKKHIRTLLTATGTDVQHWPLAAIHVGERRLRNQLAILGFPTGKLLRFGTKAFALKKSWRDRYQQWRENREEVVVLGPDVFSSLTSTSYFVQALSDGRFFFTDDVVISGDLEDF